MAGIETRRDEACPAGGSGRSAVSKWPEGARSPGAMSQQGAGAHGNESYPQKLLQLVGCRDPDAHPHTENRLTV